MQKHLPSQALLKELLSYDAENGELTWRECPRHVFATEKTWRIFNSNRAGKAAGWVDKTTGYVRIGFGATRYYAHRVIWKIVTGCEPRLIDHVNGSKTDNRIVNLRSVDGDANSRNARIGTKNKSGVMGVFWDNRKKKWRVEIGSGAKTYRRLGSFDSFDDAVAVRKRAEIDLGYHPNHGRAA